MATKFVQTSVASLNKNNANEMLMRIGQHCIKQAYAGNNEDTQYALDNLAQIWRVALVSWLRRVGKLDIQNPATGSARYMVVGVKNAKFQNKAIEASKVENVLVQEHQIKQETKPKELKGEAADRAQKAMEKIIARLKKDDPDAAALINDVWAQRTKLIMEYLDVQPQVRLAA